MKHTIFANTIALTLLASPVFTAQADSLRCLALEPAFRTEYQTSAELSTYQKQAHQREILAEDSKKVAGLLNSVLGQARKIPEYQRIIASNDFSKAEKIDPQSKMKDEALVASLDSSIASFNFTQCGPEGHSIVGSEAPEDGDAATALFDKDYTAFLGRKMKCRKWPKTWAPEREIQFNRYNSSFTENSKLAGFGYSTLNLPFANPGDDIFMACVAREGIKTCFSSSAKELFSRTKDFTPEEVRTGNFRTQYDQILNVPMNNNLANQLALDVNQYVKGKLESNSCPELAKNDDSPTVQGHSKVLPNSDLEQSAPEKPSAASKAN